jgi:fatty-acyl-CoA synthase
MPPPVLHKTLVAERQDTAMATISEAWFTPLTPLAFLERSARVYPEKTAIVYGNRRISYAEFAAAATRLAHALRASGVKPGDRVAYLVPNIPEMLIAHFGVPLEGGVLVAMNIRLGPQRSATSVPTLAATC